jgi:glycosyltransferase involved in cell wall biosynthesis
MPHTPHSTRQTRLIVFSDDWGRHPSSCQHLVGQLLARYPTLWVNTIGTRAPRLSWEDLGKAAKKISQWLRPPVKQAPASVGVPGGDAAMANLTAVTPRMFPGFRKAWQRRWNAKLMAKAIHKALGPRRQGETRVAITTIPITADLPGLLDVDRWIYYCVDDFSVWPGLDGSVLGEMDRQMALEADAILSVSKTLQDRIASWGRTSTLLTHGIDLDHWGQKAAGRVHGAGDSKQESTVDQPAKGNPKPAHSRGWDWVASPKPIFLFWGVVDQRLDIDWCLALAQLGTLILLGPRQSPSPRLMNHPRILLPGPAPYESLPALAAAADLLVMPYADLPVTRAIQPLKFKEYLATGKPVIARKLPATIEWSDAADVLATVDDLLAIVPQRVANGIPASQQFARHRLALESWGAKAEILERVLIP